MLGHLTSTLHIVCRRPTIMRKLCHSFHPPNASLWSKSHRVSAERWRVRRCLQRCRCCAMLPLPHEGGLHRTAQDTRGRQIGKCPHQVCGGGGGDFILEEWRKKAHCLIVLTRSDASGSFIFSRNSAKESGCVASSSAVSSAIAGDRNMVCYAGGRGSEALVNTVPQLG